MKQRGLLTLGEASANAKRLQKLGVCFPISYCTKTEGLPSGYRKERKGREGKNA
ncbi:hypothetical protein GXM_03125 [Nostoc sphaeroides CCNUC1]|uniref:Uncharacterized protein n=1 Tax=Nostoc sphaeroides CCNUC1 TaxID=2653204 RepID=A0A5P8VYZ0_9NOSO|nr:hypothetical protein GXM_03125 [Nostoc sphaeroides CCNUC1]